MNRLMRTSTNAQNTRSLSSIVAGMFIVLLLAVSAAAQTVIPSPMFTAFDNSGNIIALGKLCSYVGGSSTPVATYTDATLGTANQNPVVMDSAGRASIFLVSGQSYKFVLLTAASTTTDCTTGTMSVIWSQDLVSAIPASSTNLDVLGTAGTAITAGQVVYLSDGSGSLNAGQWYLADQDLPYASSRAITGVAPTAISSGTAGTIRLAGQATGLSALTPGSTYYVSGTAGGVTATAPQNRRVVGIADSTSTLMMVAGQPTQGLPIDTAIDDFRLTLQTGVPVTIADVTGASAGTIYLAPYTGNRIALYDASGNATVYTSGEISVAVPATTSQMYDIFAYANTSGAPTLELLAWTNDTTRATALVRTVAVGVYTKSGDATRRYLGSFRTTGVSGQTEDSYAKRFLWNYYHRTKRGLRIADGTNSWQYTTNTLRQSNNSTANQVAVVVGLAEVPISLRFVQVVANTNISVQAFIGIGQNATNANATGLVTVGGTMSPAANAYFNMTASLETYPAIGYSFFAMLEASVATGTATWYGDDGGAVTISGMSGSIEG